MKTKINARFIVVIAINAALAFLLQFLGSVMGLKVAGFLEIEFSEIPPLIVTFALGPVAGVLCELIKNILHLSVTSTGFVGELANFVTNGIFVFVAGIIYKYNKTRKGALISMLIGVLVMTLASILTNLFIMFPLYMADAPFSTMLNLALTVTVPFNLCRGIAASLITFVLYKHVSPLLKKK